MAEIINIKLLPRLCRGTKGAPCKHPWDEWFDGQARKLSQGTDFAATMHGMKVEIYKMAKCRGVHVSVKTLADNAFLVQKTADR